MFTKHPHRRLNPLTGEWVLISPQRISRPWLGQEEIDKSIESIPEFDPNNPLCPGVVRANSLKNPEYSNVFVFDNDFPALLCDVSELSSSNEEDPLFQVSPANGVCKVMCFHPKSNRTLALMSINEIETVVNEWILQFNELSKKYVWIQIFENKGSAMGCSNPHPHCQIWACSFLPTVPSLKDKNLRQYYKKYHRPMLDDYVAKELKYKERIVIENEDWLVVVPFWASWPYETMLISRNSNKRLNDLTVQQKGNLAKTIKELTTKYDNLFKCFFPYSMGFHGAPTGPTMLKNDDKHWTLHAIYYPPLLRSATIRKFLVGFELLSEAQRDLTAELAATNLQQLNGKEHYLKGL